MPKEDDLKNKTSPKQAPTPPDTPAIAVPPERTNFKKLLLSNPNFFGTFPKLGKVVKALSGDTTYEQLTCLGLFPGDIGNGRLEAVLNIKQHSGYGSDACGAGTTEYVRFFVQNGATWQDLGVSAVHVYDLPGALPLSYAVSVDFNEARKFCTTENILNVRAILSWNLEPTAGNPNFTPIWGNVVNARVQVAKQLLKVISLSELIATKALSVEPSILKDLDLEKPLPVNEPKELNYGELKALYANEKIPPHRFGFSEALKLTSGSIGKALSQATELAQPSIDKAAKAEAAPAISPNLFVGVDLSAILAGLESTSGDTSFEQLTCAGYNPQTRTLEAVLQMKKSSGFSGGLCTVGSTEYVSFFAFVGGAWQSLGTAHVQVYDLAGVTAAQPINYAVFRVSNVAEMPCHDLTGVPLRAILSWQTAPTGPNFIPHWGNVINTNVQPQILTGDPGTEQARLMRIGRVSLVGINASGLANPTGVAGDCAGNDSPFGGSPTVTGDFIPRVDAFDHVTGSVQPGARPIIYQVWITPSVGVPFQLTNSFGIRLYPQGGPAIGVAHTQSATLPLAPVTGGAPGALYYTYMESDFVAVEPRTLAVFNAGGLAEGNYTIEIRGFKFFAGSYVAIPTQSKMIHVYNGYPHMEAVVGGGLVAQQRPQVAITLTAPAVDCGDIQVGDTIAGIYSVTDRFFSSVSIQLIAITVGGIPQPINPVILSNVASYPGASTNGTSGTFSLSTAGMTPCGYTILLQAWDRALVSDSCSGHYNQMGVGFCLRKKD